MRVIIFSLGSTFLCLAKWIAMLHSRLALKSCVFFKEIKTAPGPAIHNM